MTDYEKFEAECGRIKVANGPLLDDFAAWLTASGLAEKTVKRHRWNIDFYINEFLLYEEAIEPADGIHEVDSFLGDWFIRKAMWSSAASIRSNAASLKKFYAFMAERGLVDKVALVSLNQTIKDELPGWLENCREQINPDREDDDEWGGW